MPFRMVSAILLLASLAAAAELPKLRIEPAAAGSIIYVKNESPVALTAWLIELVDYPGSSFSFWQDESANPIPPGGEKRVPVSSMMIGAVPEHVKMQAALFADGSSSGVPQKVAQLQQRQRASQASSSNADLILHNGKIVTVDSGFSIRQAVAIKAGKIAIAGSNAAVLAARGPNTRVIDLAGRTVLPGLFDSHVHALDAGLSEFRAPLPPLDSFAAVQNYIREQAKRTPKGEWIVVPRTFPTRLRELQMPTREVLDVATEHPVMFDASYVVIANSLALKISGITRTTPNPPGGEIVKDKNGEPNGILKNAQGLLKRGPRVAASISESDKLQALEDQLKRYVAAGLTSINDRAVNAEQIALYQKLKETGRLPIRAALTWRPDASRPTEELISAIGAAPYKTNDGDDWLKFGAFKLTLDGGM